MLEGAETMAAVAETLCVAAVQMHPTLGDVEANCRVAERLADEAFDRGADWVVLPEFFTSGMAFHPSLLDAARPADGEPTQLLRRLAKRHAGVVGGSFIALSGADAVNRFVLAFPDGATFSHDKDLPTMWENCYYRGGDDDGVLDTARGPVGVAMCWELIRSRTASRLLGRVDWVVGGTCWWDLPDLLVGPEMDALRARNLEILTDTPGTLARMLGVPLVHASNAGEFEGLMPGAPDQPYRSRWLGETQIVDASGAILARRDWRQGEGLVFANLTPGRVEETQIPIPDRFWIPELPELLLQSWEDQNQFGRDYYQKVTLPHRDPARAKPTSP
jgi:predicted amidohydrolase